MQGGGKSGRVYLGRFLTEHRVEEKITMRLTLVEMRGGVSFICILFLFKLHVLCIYISVGDSVDTYLPLTGASLSFHHTGLRIEPRSPGSAASAFTHGAISPAPQSVSL